MTFVKYQSANNAQGVLHMPISSSATSLQLKSGQGDRFKDTFPYLLAVEQLNSLSAVIKREIVKVTNKVGDVLTIVRSAGTCLPDDESTTQGTQAFSFDADVTRVMQYIMSEQIDDIQEEVERIVDEELPNKLDVSEYQEGKYVYGASSGGSDSYAITLPNPPTAYEVGQTFRFQADVGNTGSATLNVNGLGAKTIKKLHDQDLETGDIEAGQIVVVAYDGTNFQMNSQTAIIAEAETSKLVQDVVLGESMTAGDGLGAVFFGDGNNGTLTNKVYLSDTEDINKRKIDGIILASGNLNDTVKMIKVGSLEQGSCVVGSEYWLNSYYNDGSSSILDTVQKTGNTTARSTIATYAITDEFISHVNLDIKTGNASRYVDFRLLDSNGNVSKNIITTFSTSFVSLQLIFGKYLASGNLYLQGRDESGAGTTFYATNIQRFYGQYVPGHYSTEKPFFISPLLVGKGNQTGEIELMLQEQNASLLIDNKDYDLEFYLQYFGATTTIYGGVASGISMTAYQLYNVFTSSSTTASILSVLPSKNITGLYNDQPEFSEISKIEFEGDIAFGTGDERRIGFSANSGTNFYTETSTTAKVLLQHKGTNEYVNLNTADGSAYSLGSNLSVMNYRQFNKYRLVFEIGVSLKLYINDVLMETKTTNLPAVSSTSGCIFGIGTNVSGDNIGVKNMKIKIKYS